MNWHPFACKFSTLEGEEWESFKASIKKSGGNRVPIIYRTKNGVKEGIEGRMRWKACEELGLKCKMQEEILDDDEVKDFIIDHNVKRRHMSAEDRRVIVGELRSEGASTTAIADKVGVSKKTVARDIENLTTSGHLSTPEKVTGADGKSYPAPHKIKAPPGAGDSWEQQLCSRCKRLGNPVKDCPVCKEIAQANKPEVVAKPPKPGRVAFSFKEFEKSFGEVVRAVDTMYKSYGHVRPGGSVAEDMQHKAMGRLLEEFYQSMKKRFSELEKGAA